MAKHEFGIMMDAPQPGKRYDEYEPWKYDCISVDDDYVEGIAEKEMRRKKWISMSRCQQRSKGKNHRSGMTGCLKTDRMIRKKYSDS